MDLGNELKRLRTEKHLSQEAVAQELNVSRQAVAKWENNTSKPSTENLLLICDFYGITLNELISTKSQCQPESKKPKKKVITIILSVIGLIFLILSVILTVFTKRHSVPDNVIGYADGSTAIFITSSPWYLYISYGIAFAVLIALIVIFALKRKK